MKNNTSPISPNPTKADMLSWVNHELRTPLTIISLTSEMLLKDVVGNLDEESKKHLQEILNNARKMSDTLEVFLNIYREDSLS